MMNSKKRIFIILFMLGVVLIGVTSYMMSRQPRPETTPNKDQEVTKDAIDAGPFFVSLPEGWQLNKLQGIDSYIGEFVGNGAQLSFDFGWYSGSLVEDTDPKHTVTYEDIGGLEAKIVVPKVVGDGYTGVYFPDLSDNNKFTASGNNLSAANQETALKIFRSIRFKN